MVNNITVIAIIEPYTWWKTSAWILEVILEETYRNPVLFTDTSQMQKIAQMCHNRHHINSRTLCTPTVTVRASHTRTSKSSVSITPTVTRLPVLWVSVVVFPMSVKTKRSNRGQLFLISPCYAYTSFFLYMCHTWISSLFPRIKCSPSIALRDYSLSSSLTLSLFHYLIWSIILLWN